MVLTDAVLEAMLTDAIAAGGPLDPAALFLGVSPAIDAKGQATAMADVTAAAGALATRIDVAAWVGPYKMSDGRWVIDTPVGYFTPADAAGGQIINWAFLASAAVAGTLKAYQAIVPGVNLPNENASLGVMLRVTLDPSGRWGAAVIVNG